MVSCFGLGGPLGAMLAWWEGRSAVRRPGGEGKREHLLRAPLGRIRERFVAAQPLRRCRLTAHHLLSRTLQLQIKRKKMINQSNRKK